MFLDVGGQQCPEMLPNHTYVYHRLQQKFYKYATSGKPRRAAAAATTTPKSGGGGGGCWSHPHQQNHHRHRRLASSWLPGSVRHSTDELFAVLEGSSTTTSTGTGGVTIIDGSKGEGGGQLIRNAISYANILRKEVRIVNIRSARAKPGLQAQHVAGIQLATAVSGGAIVGDQVHSKEIRYRPTKLPAVWADAKFRTIRGGVNTAGSIGLMLQAAVPCALFGATPCNFYLKGGTNAIMAPQYDYLEALLLPTLRDQCGLADDQILSTVTRRGFYPKGGGKVQVRIKPLTAPLRPMNLTNRGTVRHVSIRAFRTAGIARADPETMAHTAHMYLKERLPPDATFQIQVLTETQATGECSGIFIVAETDTGCRLAGSSLGPFYKTATEIGLEAAREVFQTIQDGGCVDEWLQDQLILFAALADGISEIVTGSLTLHTQTAMLIAEKLAGAKFEVRRLDAPNSTPLTNLNHNNITDEDSTVHRSSAACGSEDKDNYAKDGRISGRHLIRCYGIGYQSSNETTTSMTKLSLPSTYLRGIGGGINGGIRKNAVASSPFGRNSIHPTKTTTTTSGPSSAMVPFIITPVGS